ncbi:MAG: prenyltransferase/squalene oxidase repeat-containing protein [Gemmatales bacterium]|nr:hypothetical protein [Gemmatales bacterium]MDW8175176.1 prenyltransferase/squalene oxidase repeat-containing protein [Gemmatales bacterium]
MSRIRVFLLGGFVMLFSIVLVGISLERSVGMQGKPAQKKLAEVDFYDIADMTTVRPPKPMSPAVKNGLAWLAKRQNPDGGWPEDNSSQPLAKSELGCSALSLLALLRGENSVRQGPYRDTVRKGLSYLIQAVADRSRGPRWVRTTSAPAQIHGKLGSYADLFLANLTLAEFRGKAGAQEHAVAVCLEKTMNQVLSLQTAEGRYRGNEGGWAPVLAMGLATKGIARARFQGARYEHIFAERAFAYSLSSVLDRPVALNGLNLVRAREDAGVVLYRISQGATNVFDLANAYRYELLRIRLFADDPLERANVKVAAQRVEKLVAHFDQVQRELLEKLRDPQFLRGVGTIGGEELLSYWNVSEVLVLLGGEDWEKWDGTMEQMLRRAQNADGSWSGQHCITGKTFCTAAALLVLLGDRTPFPKELVQHLQPRR